MKLLIDTCTFLWLIDETFNLSQRAEEAFLDEGNERYLSTATVWEISIKYSLGKIPLYDRPERVIADLRLKSGIEALHIDEPSALHVAKLPWHHKDPFDRLLVAQAIVHGMTILTPDQAIEQYAVRTLW